MMLHVWVEFLSLFLRVKRCRLTRTDALSILTEIKQTKILYKYRIEKHTIFNILRSLHYMKLNILKQKQNNSFLVSRQFAIVKDWVWLTYSEKLITYLPFVCVMHAKALCVFKARKHHSTNFNHFLVLNMS